MKLDHYAIRTDNRRDAVKFFEDAFGYKFQAEFEIYFNESKTEVAICTALEPPEKINSSLPLRLPYVGDFGTTEFHMAPEVFISEGTPGSIVDNWVKKHGSLIHHIAYEVSDVEAQRKLWIEKGWAEFTSDKAFSCGELTQIFTKPNKYSGVIYEFIERKGQHGFCRENVLDLMKSSVELDKNIK